MTKLNKYSLWLDYIKYLLYFVHMIRRALFDVAFDQEWGRQMRFVTGPRQSGKTTLAREQLRLQCTPHLYYLWDLRTVRNRYKENVLFFTEDSAPRPSLQWVCFDEIHKMPRWKDILKAVFDCSEDHYRLIVTGSAKFDISRRAGDSLSGRFFTFHLFPLMICEFSPRVRTASHTPQSAQEWLGAQFDSSPLTGDTLTDLLEFGGFPEPFLRHSKAFHRRWSKDYTDTVIKEDIGALTRIIEKEYLYDLYRLLPEMVGSPLSESSLASHLEISNPTVKSHLRRMEDFYLSFKVHPYSRNIKRALVKAPKAYLYDWSQIADPAKRFEDFIAVQLLSRLHLWSDRSGVPFRLFYVRTKEKQETDFLITRERVPWLLLEAKISDGLIAAHHFDIQEQLGQIPLVQVCREEGVASMQGKKAYRVSASRLLQ